jgi:hypothetical protein
MYTVTGNWAAGIALLLLAGPASSDPWVELEGRYWITNLDARARASFSTGSNFEFDLPNDLGIDDENFGNVRVTVRPPTSNMRFRLDYTPMSYEGDRTITRTVTFGGQTYAAGTRIQTEVDIHYARAAWTWQFLKVPFSDIVKIGPMIEAKGFWIESSLTASGSQNVARDFAMALPTIGLAADVNPTEHWNFFAEVSGIPGGSYGHFLDAEMGVRYEPLPYLNVVAGYRIFDIEANDDPDFATFQVGGPFLGGAFRF